MADDKKNKTFDSRKKSNLELMQRGFKTRTHLAERKAEKKVEEKEGDEPGLISRFLTASRPASKAKRLLKDKDQKNK